MLTRNHALLTRIGRVLGRPWLAWLTLGLSTLLFLGLWHSANLDYAERSQIRFEHRAKVQQAELAERMLDYVQVLNGAAGLFKASDWVSRTEWHDYIAALDLDRTRPGVLGTGVTLMLPASERQRHEAEIRAEGFPDYAIHPAGDRPQLSAIVYLEPFSGDNLRAFGYDMFSEPVRQAAMIQARDTGLPAMSAKVTLIQEGNRGAQAGFLIYHPLYQKNAPLDSVEDRRKAIRGFVYSPFRVSDIIGHIFKSSVVDVDMAIFDGPPTPENLLFSSDTTPRIPRHVLDMPTEIAGHPWTLRFHSSRQFEAQTHSSQPALLLTGGMIFSLMLFALVYMLGRHSRQMEATTQELERGRDELRAAANYARNLLEASLDPLVTIDANGQISDANLAAEQVTGVQRNKLIGTVFSSYFTDPVQAENGYRQVFASGTVRDYPLTIRHVSGQLTEVLYNAAVYRDDHGEVAGVFAAARDVTQANAVACELQKYRQHLESMVAERTEALAQAKEAAEAATDAKSAFLAKMSHELHTPMNGVIGLANILKRGELNPRQQDQVQKILSVSHHLLQLIDDILDFARLDTAQLKLQHTDFQPRPLADEVLESLRSRAEQKGLSLTLRIDEAVPQRMSGDALKIRQVFLKLAENAVKFTAQGSISLSLHVETKQGKDLLCFVVEDTGIGIHPEDQKRLFQYFEQSDNSLSRRYDGAGLGLAIARRLVELMGGEIAFSSRAEQGSRFSFYVPIKNLQHTPSLEPAPEIVPKTSVDRSNPASSALSAPDARQLAEFIRVFRPLLLESDFAATSYWQENEAALAPLLAEDSGRFRMAMETMDLALALELLDQALAKHPEITSLL